MGVFFGLVGRMLRNLEQTVCRSSSHGLGISTPGRAKRGIFAGKCILTGHNVSHSNRRTKKKLLPNVQKKFFWSGLLDKWIRVNVTTHALRCIDRVGDFDEFILFSRPRLLEDSDFAKDLKSQLVPLWEQQNGRKFNRSQIVFERRMQILSDRREQVINQMASSSTIQARE